MAYYSDGHTALDSKILERIETPDLKLLLVKRFLDDGKEDLVVHGSSNTIILGSPITALTMLVAVGFTASRSCTHFGQQNCVYKIFPTGATINLQDMCKTVSEAAPKMREAERALNNCGWSMIKESQTSIKEGHRAALKSVMKTTGDANFIYVLTYAKDQYGNGRFVTHFVPKDGPNYKPELSAVMKWLELKEFNGCPESPYRKCYFITLDNTQTDNLFNRTADRAHRMYDNLATEFGKAYQIMVDTDVSLRKIGLQMLEIETVKMTTAISIPSNPVPNVSTVTNRIKETNPKFEWDVFVCHASEDKDKFVRQLAQELGSRGLKIWYDEFTLKVGDSLRQSIEKGLAKSRYGIVVLSSHFFAKKWPQDELNGLAAKERDGEKVILPVWLDVNEKYIVEYSPILADRVAAKASEGMAKVVSDLLDAINPQE